jgi:leucyl-tRNA synthetase
MHATDIMGGITIIIIITTMAIIVRHTLGMWQCVGVALGIDVVHPLTKELLPVYVCGYVVHDYGCAAVMGVPAHDERDQQFAEQHRIACKPSVFSDGESSSSVLCHSQAANGLSLAAGAKAIVNELEAQSAGRSTVSYRIRDWLVSRQRYWGAPIPIVYCHNRACTPEGEPIAVPESQLPVELPAIRDEQWRSSTSASAFPTLADFPDWLKTTCPRCGGEAHRDTDTMDTFVDSSWYFLRYADARNAEQPFDKERVNRMMPVDIYIGGIEHAVLHLLYSRFITRFLHHHEKLLDHPEPFTKLLTQGMVQATTYRHPSTKAALTPEQLEERGGQMYVAGTDGSVKALVSHEKMSKSKFNGVDPVVWHSTLCCTHLRPRL